LKIGKFAAKHGISIDTVRHYMNLGLLFPEKMGGWYEFGDNCNESIDAILHYKEMGFSLDEIHELLNFQRFSRLTIKTDLEFFKSKFLSKTKDLEVEMEHLEHKLRVISNLLDKIDHLEESKFPTHATGVPLDFLNALQCPICKKNFDLTQANIVHNMITHGELKCDCGNHWQIVHGILAEKHLSDKFVNLSSEEVIERNIHLKTDYYKSTSSKFLDFIFQGVEWQRQRLIDLLTPNSIILEPGIGLGIALSNFYDYLPDDMRYIGVDDQFERLLFVKTLFDREYNPKRLMYICCSFDHIPLKPDSVDFVMDYKGSFDYNSQHDIWLTENLKTLLKDGAHWIGSFLFYSKQSELMNYPESIRRVLDLKNIQEDFKNHAMEVELQKIIGPVDESGKTEIFKNGLSLYQWLMLGKNEKA
jgi:DNA-binding transcriptional MerR regulator/ubiquinone/menaquinone biosynthesis C-methylase UbiE/uncharacterized protein YbaR (Trm112 family)